MSPLPLPFPLDDFIDDYDDDDDNNDNNFENIIIPNSIPNQTLKFYLNLFEFLLNKINRHLFPPTSVYKKI